MSIYYKQENNSIIAYANYPFEEGVIITERNIVYGPINSKGEISVPSGQVIGLYFEDEVPIVEDVTELPTTEDRIDAVENTLLEILGGLYDV